MNAENDAPQKVIEHARERARLVIKHHFGSNAKKMTFKSSGLSNFVFAAKHAEGDFIVRISPDLSRLNSFIKEQWAQARAAEAGVPTAEILEVGMEIIGQPFMISHVVAGEEATHHPNRAEILRELGGYAALINSISTDGFGTTFDWSNNQLSRNEKWKDYLQKELNYAHRLKMLEKRKMLSAKQVRQLEKIFAAAERLKPKARLNHSDLRLKNVMVDEKGCIKAILDWENCVSTLAPHWELSLALHDLTIDEKHFFLEGYGMDEKTFTEYAPLIKAFNIVNYSGPIEQLAEEKENAELKKYRMRLSGALDFYSLLN